MEETAPSSLLSVPDVHPHALPRADQSPLCHGGCASEGFLTCSSQVNPNKPFPLSVLLIQLTWTEIQELPSANAGEAEREEYATGSHYFRLIAPTASPGPAGGRRACYAGPNYCNGFFYTSISFLASWPWCSSAISTFFFLGENWKRLGLSLSLSLSLSIYIYNLNRLLLNVMFISWKSKNLFELEYTILQVFNP